MRSLHNVVQREVGPGRKRAGTRLAGRKEAAGPFPTVREQGGEEGVEEEGRERNAKCPGWARKRARLG